MGLIAGTLAVALAASGAGAAQSQPVGCTSSGSRIIEHGPRAQKVVALTFDDGPSKYTKRVLRLLDGAGVKATFFPVGTAVEGREKLLRQEFAAGMEIGNHTFTHADLGNGGPEATKEMRKQTALIRKVLGYTPCLFRPPYDSFGDDLLKRARALDMSSISGEVDPRDWELPGKEAIVQTVLDNVRSGSIIILHDGGDGPRTQTLAALPTILATLKERGYRMTTVTDLLGYKTIPGR
jgi:peptidoglycan/xylan/chitin deacetylase (PgdA/CDA1 family)